jgi:F-type H+-transporting ATPase subunit b
VKRCANYSGFIPGVFSAVRPSWAARRGPFAGCDDYLLEREVTSLAAILLAENILSIDGSFLFVFVSIILLIFILNATLFKPINRVLEERGRLSGGRLAEARQLLARYDERLRHYEEQVRAARAEAYRHAEEQRRQELAAREEALAGAKSAVAAEIAAARREIGEQSAAARAGLEREARAMAARISSQILQRPVTTPEGA